MSRICLLLCILAGPALLNTLRGDPPPSEAASSARTAALDVAGAFANDGFKLRDGFWSARIEKGARQTILVNLFAGNHYWFSVAASDGARPVIELFNEQGQRLEAEAWKDAARSAAGLSPAASGPYYLRIRLEEGGPADFCMVYSYK